MKFRNIALCALCALCALSAVACKKEAPSGEASKGAASVSGDKVKSVGRAHLPSGCEVVVSLDWPRFRELEPVKGNIDRELTKFEAPPVANAPIDPEVAADMKNAKEFLEKTHIDLRRDPGELALCAWKIAEAQGDKPPSFVLVLGGQFIPGAALEVFDSFSERFKTLLSRAKPGSEKKPAPEIIEVAGVKVAYDKAEGIYMGQAKDGAFVIANDRPAFEKSLTASEAHLAYKLPNEPIAPALTQAAAPLVTAQLAQSPLAPAAGAFAGANLAYTEGLIKLQLDLTNPAVMPALVTNLDMFIKPNPSMPPNPLSQLLAGAKMTTAGSTLSLEVVLPEETTRGLLQQAGMGAPQPRPLYGGPAGMPPGTQLPPGAGAPPATK